MQGRTTGRVLRSLCHLAIRSLVQGLLFIFDLLRGILDPLEGESSSQEPSASSPSPPDLSSSATLRQRWTSRRGAQAASSSTISVASSDSASSWQIPPRPAEFFDLATLDSESIPAEADEGANAEVFERFLQDHSRLHSRTVGLNRWQKLILLARQRREWSMRGQMLKCKQHGMPKNLDGPAKGFGKHLGRWGYNEIRHFW